MAIVVFFYRHFFATATPSPCKRQRINEKAPVMKPAPWKN